MAFRDDEFEDTEEYRLLRGTVARRLRRLRQERELTQRDLSELAKVSGPHIGYIEAGVGNVSLVVLAKLAGALGVSVVDFFEGRSVGSTIHSTLSRMAANQDKIVQHLDRRRDEVARYNDDLRELLGRRDLDKAKAEEEEEVRLLAESNQPPAPLRVRVRKRKSARKRE